MTVDAHAQPSGRDVSVIVVSWNTAPHLQPCLDAFAAQDHPVDILVVDNASTDETPQILDRAERSGVRVIRNRTNRGYAGGANDGIAVTTAPVVIVANPDVRPERGFVSAATAALDADPRIGSVQGRLLRLEPDRPRDDARIDTAGHEAFRVRLFGNRGEGQPDGVEFDAPTEVFGVSGALAVYRRAMLDDVAVIRAGRRPEVFDEGLFAFFEDVDLDWRARLRGWTAVYAPSAVAWHERGGAGPRRSPTVESLSWRNRLLVLAKHDVVPLPGEFLGFLVTTLLKTAELLLTHPHALAGGIVGLWRGLPRALADRRRIRARATVPPGAVVEQWFIRFDAIRWVQTWWRRVSRIRFRSASAPR